MRDLPIREFLSDRIWRNGALIVLCLGSILSLKSQSAASFSTYILAIVMLAGFRYWKDIFSSCSVWLLIGLLVYLTASSFWSEPFDVSNFRSIAIRALLVFLFVVALAECQLRGQVQRWLARSFAVVGLIAVLAALVSHLYMPPVDGRLRGLGQLDNPVVAAFVWAVLLVFGLYLCVADRRVEWRLVGVLSVTAFVCAIGMSGSRAAWVAASSGSLVFLVSTYCTRRRSIYILSTCLLVLGVAIGLAGAFLSESEIAALFPRGSSFRPEIWSAALASVFPEHFLFGLGILTADDFLIRGQVFEHPHSMYISMIYQGGVVALLMFLLTLGWAILVFAKHFAENDAKLGLAILAVAIPAYLLDGHELVDKVGDTWLLFWLPMGLALGIQWRESASYRVR